MRVPTRKSENRPKAAYDPFITQKKYDEIRAKLDRLKKTLPGQIEEVQRLAQLGDFSENAEYQMAKGRLRSSNRRVDEMEYQLSHAEIIKDEKNSDKVRLGNFVTVETLGKTKRYQILGSTESNPAAGVISRHSPLGSALMGCQVGDIVEVELANKKVFYKLLKIE